MPALHQQAIEDLLDVSNNSNVACWTKFQNKTSNFYIPEMAV